MLTYKIHILRHGFTQANLEGRYIGSTDLPLCEEGRAQLLALRERCEYPWVDRVYTSPLARAKETAELLYTCGLVENIGQIYDLTSEKLSQLERIGEKTAQRIMRGIEESKSVPFERVIYALSIPNVGETTAKRLARAVTSMENMQSMELEQLSAIPDIGPVIARNIYDFLREPVNAANIRRLTEAGVQMKVDEEKLRPSGSSLDGKTIVISGTFARHSRDEYKEIIMREGGKNAGSISKKTSFVLAGENMGPAKLEKCRQLGIPLVSEDEFISIIESK